MTPLRRYLHRRKLRIDWLAERTGIAYPRMARLTAGLARWRASEAAAVTDALLPGAEDDTDRDALYHTLFEGVEVRPDKPDKDAA